MIIYNIVPHFISQKEKSLSTVSALLGVLGLYDTGEQRWGEKLYMLF